MNLVQNLWGYLNSIINKKKNKQNEVRNYYSKCVKLYAKRIEAVIKECGYQIEYVLGSIYKTYNN